MASFMGPVNLRPYGTRAQIMRIPPVPAPSTSNKWTALYLVSHPLPAHVSVIQFDIISHDQGWCSNPQDGVWSWFEVSILGLWQEHANPDFRNLSDFMYLRPCPEDFGQTFQEQGLYFKDIPQGRNEGAGTVPSLISVPVAWNTIQRDWQHQAVTWTRNNNDGDDGGFLPLLEEGDRLAFWARAQFPGWMNFVKEVRVMISTDPIQRAPRNLHDLSPAILTEHEQPDKGRISNQGRLEPSSIAQIVTVPVSNINQDDDPTIFTNVEDLKEAIRVSRQTVQVTSDDHPELAGSLSNLGLKLVRRYKHTGEIDDLEEAIRVSRQAVQLTPNNYPDLAT